MVIYVKSSSASKKRVRSTLSESTPVKAEGSDFDELEESEEEEKVIVKRPTKPSPHRKHLADTDDTESDDEPLKKKAAVKRDVKGKGRAVSPETVVTKGKGKAKKEKVVAAKKPTKAKAKVDIKGKGKAKQEDSEEDSDFVDEDQLDDSGSDLSEVDSDEDEEEDESKAVGTPAQGTLHRNT